MLSCTVLLSIIGIQTWEISYIIKHLDDVGSGDVAIGEVGSGVSGEGNILALDVSSTPSLYNQFISLLRRFTGLQPLYGTSAYPRVNPVETIHGPAGSTDNLLTQRVHTLDNGYLGAVGDSRAFKTVWYGGALIQTGATVVYAADQIHHLNSACAGDYSVVGNLTSGPVFDALVQNCHREKLSTSLSGITGFASGVYCYDESAFLAGVAGYSAGVGAAAFLGAEAGSVFLPGVGTAVGALIGGLIGQLSCARVASASTSSVADAAESDVNNAIRMAINLGILVDGDPDYQEQLTSFRNSHNWYNNRNSKEVMRQRGVEDVINCTSDNCYTTELDCYSCPIRSCFTAVPLCRIYNQVHWYMTNTCHERGHSFQLRIEDRNGKLRSRQRVDHETCMLLYQAMVSYDNAKRMAARDTEINMFDLHLDYIDFQISDLYITYLNAINNIIWTTCRRAHIDTNCTSHFDALQYNYKTIIDIVKLIDMSRSFDEVTGNISSTALVQQMRLSAIADPNVRVDPVIPITRVGVVAPVNNPDFGGNVSMQKDFCKHWCYYFLPVPDIYSANVAYLDSGDDACYYSYEQYDPSNPHQYAIRCVVYESYAKRYNRMPYALQMSTEGWCGTNPSTWDCGGEPNEQNCFNPGSRTLRSDVGNCECRCQLLKDILPPAPPAPPPPPPPNAQNEDVCCYYYPHIYLPGPGSSGLWCVTTRAECSSINGYPNSPPPRILTQSDQFPVPWMTYSECTRSARCIVNSEGIVQVARPPPSPIPYVPPGGFTRG